MSYFRENVWTRIETILRLVLQFQVDRSRFNQSINLLVQIKIHKIDSNDNAKWTKRLDGHLQMPTVKPITLESILHIGMPNCLCMHVAGGYHIDYWSHCVNGDSLEIGKWQNSTPHRIKTAKPIVKAMSW